MDFDRLLDGAKVAGNLFVQFASDDMFEHFPLTRCERGQVRANFGKVGLPPPKGAVFLNGHTNGCKQVFIVHGLGEEITRAVFHRPDALRNITVTGQKNNGQDTAFFCEDALKFEAIEGRHIEIEHKTPRYARISSQRQPLLLIVDHRLRCSFAQFKLRADVLGSRVLLFPKRSTTAGGIVVARGIGKDLIAGSIRAFTVLPLGSASV